MLKYRHTYRQASLITSISEATSCHSGIKPAFGSRIGRTMSGHDPHSYTTETNYTLLKVTLTICNRRVRGKAAKESMWRRSSTMKCTNRQHIFSIFTKMDVVHDAGSDSLYPQRQSLQAGPQVSFLTPINKIMHLIKATHSRARVQNSKFNSISCKREIMFIFRQHSKGAWLRFSVH